MTRLASLLLSSPAMGEELKRREVLQGAAAVGVASVLGAATDADASGGPGKSARTVAPATFISHGSPMTALDADDFPRALRAFGESAHTARALVVVSAHWETPGGVRVTASEAPPLVYDFFGFPDALYRLTYPSPGAPALAEDIVSRLTDAGVPAVADASRGLDHGTWVPLRLAFPEAKLPVVQVSLPAWAPAPVVARMGEALRPLRSEGVLLMGSGSMTHNLRRFSRDKHAPVEAWAAEFDTWVAERLAARDFSGLLAWERAPQARAAHPSAEHFLPLFFVLGAALPEDRLTPVYEGFQHGTLSMRSFALRG